MKRYIFGLGTGRCGTMSLARLLDMQEGAHVTHECLVLPWSANESIARAYVKTINRRPADIIGDVAFYLLPYAEMLMDLCKEAKFVIMCRDQQETVRSYMAKTEGTNHWQEHDASRYARCQPWDYCYPKYPEWMTKEEAIAAYWEAYYDRAGRLARRYPETVRLMATEDLNRLGEVRHMLRWLGLKKPNVQAGIRVNQGLD